MSRNPPVSYETLKRKDWVGGLNGYGLLTQGKVGLPNRLWRWGSQPYGSIQSLFFFRRCSGQEGSFVIRNGRL